MPVIFLSLVNCMQEPLPQADLPEDQESSSKPSKKLTEQTELSSIEVPEKHISENTEPCEKQPVFSKIKVDISEQKLYLYCYYQGNKKEVKTYPVSTSKYGIGSQAGSNKTPLGLHQIEKKIGDGARKYTIFRARQNTGRLAKLNTPNAGDLVTTRIMWLKGLEPGKNSGPGIDSYRRYIYIHGTGEENKIGQPASHGCIRMYNSDVIDLYKRVSEGMEVSIER